MLLNFNLVMVTSVKNRKEHFNAFNLKMFTFNKTAKKYYLNSPALAINLSSFA